MEALLRDPSAYRPRKETLDNVHRLFKGRKVITDAF